MRILIVDDDVTSRIIIYTFLTKYGECDIAASGMEALSAFDLAIQGSSPYDLVTLDVNMPAPDGLQVLSMIRDRESKLGIPRKQRAKIIMTTSLCDDQSITTAASRGCDCYLVKPIAWDTLNSVLRSMGFSKD